MRTLALVELRFTPRPVGEPLPQLVSGKSTQVHWSLVAMMGAPFGIEPSPVMPASCIDWPSLPALPSVGWLASDPLLPSMTDASASPPSLPGAAASFDELDDDDEPQAAAQTRRAKAPPTDDKDFMRRILMCAWPKDKSSRQVGRWRVISAMSTPAATPTLSESTRPVPWTPTMASHCARTRSPRPSRSLPMTTTAGSANAKPIAFCVA